MDARQVLARRLFFAVVIGVGGCNLLDSKSHLVGGDYPEKPHTSGGSSGTEAGNGGEGATDVSEAGGKHAGARGGAAMMSAGARPAEASGEGGLGTSGQGDEPRGGNGAVVVTGKGGRRSGGGAGGRGVSGGNGGRGVAGAPPGEESGGGAAGETDQSGTGSSPRLTDCFDAGNCDFGAASPLVASGNTTCFLRSDGRVQCWGENSVTVPSVPMARISGGDYTFSGLSTAGDVISFSSGQVLGSGFSRLDAWGSMAAALRADGTVESWGDVTGIGGPGLFWAGPIDQNTRFKRVAVGLAGICGIHGTGAATCWPTSRVSLSAGRDHTCVVALDGTLQCWGDDTYGQASPPSGGNFTQVSAGAEHTCALTAMGDIWCWGDDSHGETEPTPGVYLGVVSGKGFSCGSIEDSDSPRCWGKLPFPEASIPSLGPGGTVAAGDAHVCSLSRPVTCFGDDSQGQASPPAASYMIAIAAGSAHTCGILEFDQSGAHRPGDILCWGSNSDGQATPPRGTFTAVAAGAAHTCALDSTGEVHCWGRNDHGQTQAPSGQFVAVSAGGSHSCAVSVAGDTLCWGDPAFEQLNPPAPPTFSELALGSQSAGRVSLGLIGASAICGVHTDGTRFCANASTPFVTLPAQDLHGFAIGDDLSGAPVCALRADQSIVCWGESWSYTLFTPPAGTFDFVTVGAGHACALRTNGTVTCWGDNSHGQLAVPAELAGP